MRKNSKIRFLITPVREREREIFINLQRFGEEQCASMYFISLKKSTSNACKSYPKCFCSRFRAASNSYDRVYSPYDVSLPRVGFHFPDFFQIDPQVVAKHSLRTRSREREKKPYEQWLF